MKRTAVVLALCFTCLLAGDLIFRGKPLNLVPRVHARNNTECTTASFQGTFGFVKTGMNNDLGGPIAGVGIVQADGEGNLTFHGPLSRNGEIIEDGPVTSLTYTVNPDCTGTAFNNATGERVGFFVIVNGGNEYLALNMLSRRVVTEIGKRQ